MQRVKTLKQQYNKEIVRCFFPIIMEELAYVFGLN